MEKITISKELLNMMFMLKNGKEQLFDLLIGAKEISELLLENGMEEDVSFSLCGVIEEVNDVIGKLGNIS